MIAMPPFLFVHTFEKLMKETHTVRVDIHEAAVYDSCNVLEYS